MNSRELIRLLKKDGWDIVRVRGSHNQFKHPEKPGTVTIPHPRKDFPKKTVQSIMKQAGLE